MDARLLAPAGAAWAGAAFALLACSAWPGITVPVIVAALLGAAISCAISRRATVRVIALASAFGILLGAVHVHARHGEPLDTWVATRASVDALATVTGDPKQRSNSSAPVWMSQNSTSVAIRVTGLSRRATSIALNASMELRLSEGQVAPPVGAHIVVRMRLAPAPWNRD